MTRKEAIKLLATIRTPGASMYIRTLDFVHALDLAIGDMMAQQPRVMTLEELDDLRGRGQAVYYQDRNAAVKSQDAFFVANDHGVAWFKGETYTFCKTADGYGEVWRCWTSRPTDEQRKAVKWDD